MTYGELITEGTTEVNDSSTRAKTIIAFGLNEGLVLFRNKLKRGWSIQIKRFNITLNSGIYQAPEDMIMPDAVTYVDASGNRTPLVEITDENEWNRLNYSPQSGQPHYIRWLTNDLFQIFPTPDANVTNGGEIKYLGKAKPLSQTDYSTGTVAVTNGSDTIVGTGTTFSPAMVGRSFRLADGNDDLTYYRISTYVDATHIKIENYFMGNTGSGLNYLIGEEPNIPREYHPALLNNGLARYYRSRKNRSDAQTAQDSFTITLEQAEADYSGFDTSNVIESKLRRPSDIYSRGVRDPQRYLP